MSHSAPTLYWESHGPANAETVVLSAGLGGSGQYWAPQLPALKERYRVLVYDHFGTGRSRGQVPEYYTMADMAAELEATLDDAGAGIAPEQMDNRKMPRPWRSAHALRKNRRDLHRKSRWYFHANSTDPELPESALRHRLGSAPYRGIRPNKLSRLQ